MKLTRSRKWGVLLKYHEYDRGVGSEAGSFRERGNSASVKVTCEPIRNAIKQSIFRFTFNLLNSAPCFRVRGLCDV